MLYGHFIFTGRCLVSTKDDATIHCIKTKELSVKLSSVCSEIGYKSELEIPVSQLLL